MCYNCLDRHVEAGNGDLVALIYDSAYTGEQVKFTYREMQSIVAKYATILKTKFGV